VGPVIPSIGWPWRRFGKRLKRACVTIEAWLVRLSGGTACWVGVAVHGTVESPLASDISHADACQVVTNRPFQPFSVPPQMVSDDGQTGRSLRRARMTRMRRNRTPITHAIALFVDRLKKGQ
jgi:hypothetical protein